MICLSDQKRELRTMALQRRAKITKSINTTHVAKSLELNFLTYFKPTRKVSIAVYWPIRQEIDVFPLLCQLDTIGCLCFLPAVIGRQEPLQFRIWKPGDNLVRSQFGILEPPVNHTIGTPDIIIIPLLAFDSAGYRLGYGGGFYDRTLAELRDQSDVFAIGAAFEGQKIDSVPHDKFDQRLDAVVTEKHVLQIIKNKKQLKV